MGQFSWLDCITQEQVLDDVKRKVYVLVPQQFGGGHIEEECYDGYGRFGGHDIYDLVADWNKEFIELPKKPNPDKYDGYWYGYAVSSWEREKRMVVEFKGGTSDEAMDARYGDGWKRLIGIDIACYDEDNASLRYPIKITHDPNAVYEWCAPSRSDPNQGWPV